MLGFVLGLELRLGKRGVFFSCLEGVYECLSVRA